MLQLRPNCECCDKRLPPESTDAVNCTFECTFCSNCAENVLHGRCSNCGGNFSARPIRPPLLVAKYATSSVHVLKTDGRPAAA